jgi:glutaminyl-tRNA synthetase
MFIELSGVAKAQSSSDYAMLEYCVREDLKPKAPRYMAVLDPVKLVIDNYPEDQVEWMEASNNPENPDMGTRKVPFCKELYIDREDFMEEPPKKFFRLKPGGEVRLKYGYIIKCEEVIKDENGEIIEIRCTHDPSSKPGAGPWRSVKGTIHWVPVEYAKPIEVRLYDRLFTEADMGGIPEGQDYKSYLNPESLVVVPRAYAEPALLEDRSGISVQFERNGYYILDPDSTPEQPIFNRATGLKSSF